MKRYFFFIILSIVLGGSLVCGLGVNIPPTSYNNNTAFVNLSSNSLRLEGYSITSLWTYYTGLGNALWCQLTGCNMTGDIKTTGQIKADEGLRVGNLFRIMDRSNLPSVVDETTTDLRAFQVGTLYSSNFLANVNTAYLQTRASTSGNILFQGWDGDRETVAQITSDTSQPTFDIEHGRLTGDLDGQSYDIDTTGEGKFGLDYQATLGDDANTRAGYFYAGSSYAEIMSGSEAGDFSFGGGTNRVVLADSTYAINTQGDSFFDGDIYLGGDNLKTYFGTGVDSSIYYDGTNMVFNTTEVGSGLAYFSDDVSATGYYTRTSVYDKNQGSALDKIKDSDSLRDSETGEINHEEFYGFVEYATTDYSRPVNSSFEIEVCEIPKENKTEIKKVCDYIFDGKYYEEHCYNIPITKEQNKQDCSKQECKYVEVFQEDSKTEEIIIVGYEKECSNVCVDVEPECHNETNYKITYPYKKLEEGVNLVEEIELLRQALFEQKQINTDLESRLYALENPIGEVPK